MFKFDGLLALVKEYIVDVWKMFGKYENINYMILTQDLVGEFLPVSRQLCCIFLS